MNKSSLYTIKEFDKKDISQISKIHKKSLPNDFCSILGTSFLKNNFYKEIINDKSAIKLCIEKDNIIYGFIIFINDKKYLSKIVYKHFFHLIYYSIKNIYKVSFILYLFDVIKIVYLKKNFKYENGYELSYVAVKEIARKNGLGSMLIKKGLENIIQNQNSQFCWVKTLTKTKETIIFYEKLGFEKYHQFLERTYLYKVL